jgi:hypothetical protein
MKDQIFKAQFQNGKAHSEIVYPALQPVEEINVRMSCPNTLKFLEDLYTC